MSEVNNNEECREPPCQQTKRLLDRFCELMPDDNSKQVCKTSVEDMRAGRLSPTEARHKIQDAVGRDVFYTSLLKLRDEIGGETENVETSAAEEQDKGQMSEPISDKHEKLLSKAQYEASMAAKEAVESAQEVYESVPDAAQQTITESTSSSEAQE